MVWKVIGFIAAVAALVAFCYFANKLSDASVDNDEFASVCDYQGGTVQGDVCVKGHTVLLTQDEWKERVK